MVGTPSSRATSNLTPRPASRLVNTPSGHLSTVLLLGRSRLPGGTTRSASGLQDSVVDHIEHVTTIQTPGGGEPPTTETGKARQRKRKARLLEEAGLS